MSDVTRGEQGRGDEATEQLLPLVYEELRRLAAWQLSREKPGQTLQATALVHEAYLRLVNPTGDARWENRAHFFAAAAEAMRRILVDAARRKRRPKHGGDLRRRDEDAAVEAIAPPVDDFLSMNEALEKLAAVDEASASLVKLRYFAGLSSADAAEMLGLAPRTAERRWAYARAWLREEMLDDSAPKTGE